MTTDHLQFRREDLAAMTSAYLHDSRAPRQWSLVGAGIGALALGPGLILLGGVLGWSPRLDPYFFFGGWAILLACGFTLLRRERALRRRYDFRCPVCDAVLLRDSRSGWFGTRGAGHHYWRLSALRIYDSRAVTSNMRCSCRARDLRKSLRFSPIMIFPSPAAMRIFGRPPAAELGR